VRCSVGSGGVWGKVRVWGCGLGVQQLEMFMPGVAMGKCTMLHASRGVVKEFTGKVLCLSTMEVVRGDGMGCYRQEVCPRGRPRGRREPIC